MKNVITLILLVIGTYSSACTFRLVPPNEGKGFEIDREYRIAVADMIENETSCVRKSAREISEFDIVIYAKLVQNQQNAKIEVNYPFYYEQKLFYTNQIMLVAEIKDVMRGKSIDINHEILSMRTVATRSKDTTKVKIGVSLPSIEPSKSRREIWEWKASQLPWGKTRFLPPNYFEVIKKNLDFYLSYETGKNKDHADSLAMKIANKIYDIIDYGGQDSY